jgi:divalent metal cation (Fe/Co/Zn/Cd) transporter
VSTTEHRDHAARAAAVSPADRARLGRRAQLIAATSVVYNLAEAAIAITAGVVAGSVAFEALRALLSGSEPDASRIGIGLAIASLVVMPVLSWAQRRTGRALHSNAVYADGTQTLLCTWMSAALLGGLVLNATLGWAWADPVAGLLIAAIAFREGWQAWRGEGCCAPAAPGAVAACSSPGADDDCC